MKCLNCGKEFSPKRTTAKFDTGVCRVEYSRKKLIESLPNFIKPGTSQEEINKKVIEVKKKATERVGITFTKDDVFLNGVLIPEEELNYAYRGIQGKGNLAQDLVYKEFFRLPDIILYEKDRLESVQKRKDSSPDEKYHLKVEKPTKEFKSERISFGGVTRQHRVHYSTPTGPVSFPLQTGGKNEM